MATVVSDAPGSRPWASQEETSPFLLEHMLAVQRGRQSQDETAPFPLVLGLFARRRACKHEAPPPTPTPHAELDCGATEAGDLEAPSSRSERPTARPAQQQPHERQPHERRRGLEASSELQEYALRVAAGEDLPPYRGRILASDAAPDAALDATFAEQRPRPPGEKPTQAGGVKLLGLLLMLTGLVAAATAGDDAELRAAGQAISRFLMGESAPSELSTPIAPASGVQAPCASAPPAAAR